MLQIRTSTFDTNGGWCITETSDNLSIETRAYGSFTYQSTSAENVTSTRTITQTVSQSTSETQDVYKTVSHRFQVTHNTTAGNTTQSSYSFTTQNSVTSFTTSTFAMKAIAYEWCEESVNRYFMTTMYDSDNSVSYWGETYSSTSVDTDDDGIHAKITVSNAYDVRTANLYSSNIGVTSSNSYLMLYYSNYPNYEDFYLHFTNSVCFNDIGSGYDWNYTGAYLKDDHVIHVPNFTIAKSVSTTSSIAITYNTTETDTETYETTSCASYTLSETDTVTKTTNCHYLSMVDSNGSVTRYGLTPITTSEGLKFSYSDTQIFVTQSMELLFDTITEISSRLEFTETAEENHTASASYFNYYVNFSTKPFTFTTSDMGGQRTVTTYGGSCRIGMQLDVKYYSDGNVSHYGWMGSTAQSSYPKVIYSAQVAGVTRRSDNAVTNGTISSWCTTSSILWGMSCPVVEMTRVLAADNVYRYSVTFGASYNRAIETTSSNYALAGRAYWSTTGLRSTHYDDGITSTFMDSVNTTQLFTYSTTESNIINSVISSSYSSGGYVTDIAYLATKNEGVSTIGTEISCTSTRTVNTTYTLYTSINKNYYINSTLSAEYTSNSTRYTMDVRNMDVSVSGTDTYTTSYHMGAKFGNINGWKYKFLDTNGGVTFTTSNIPLIYIPYDDFLNQYQSTYTEKMCPIISQTSELNSYLLPLNSTFNMMITDTMNVAIGNDA